MKIKGFTHIRSRRIKLHFNTRTDSACPHSKAVFTIGAFTSLPPKLTTEHRENTVSNRFKYINNKRKRRREEEEECWDGGWNTAMREMKLTTFTQPDSRTILGNTSDRMKIIGRRGEQRWRHIQTHMQGQERAALTVHEMKLWHDMF